MSAIDSADIEWALMRDRSGRATVVPRFTPPGWWECDVAELTEAGYLREYEIKVSKSDFYADRRKSQNVLMVPGDWGSQVRKTKHELLASGWTKGPSVFYFACPEGILTEGDMPQWAGLIHVFRRGPTSWPEEKIIKKAPSLHREKVGEKMWKNMAGCCHGRIHHLWAQQYYRYCGRRTRQEAKNAS